MHTYIQSTKIVCMWVYMPRYEYTHTYTHINTHTYARSYIHAYIQIHIQLVFRLCLLGTKIFAVGHVPTSPLFRKFVSESRKFPGTRFTVYMQSSLNVSQILLVKILLRAGVETREQSITTTRRGWKICWT